MSETIDLTDITIDQLDRIPDMPTLTEWTKDCKACTLREQSFQVTHGSGDDRSPILFIGTNPDFTDDGTNIPLSGAVELATSRCSTCSHFNDCYSYIAGISSARETVKECRGHNPLPLGKVNTVPTSIKIGPHKLGGIRTAGQLFDDVLNALGIDRSKVFITNTALCKSYAGDPRPEHILSCSRIRLRTQRLLRPRVIVTLGSIALSQYTSKKTALAAAHGIPFVWKDSEGWGAQIVPTYHPAQILRMIEEDVGYKSIDEITARKWDLYEDIASAVNLLEEDDLKRIVLKEDSIVEGSLKSSRRPVKH